MKEKYYLNENNELIMRWQKMRKLGQGIQGNKLSLTLMNDELDFILSQAEEWKKDSSSRIRTLGLYIEERAQKIKSMRCKNGKS